MIKERISLILSFILIFNLLGVHNLYAYAGPVLKEEVITENTQATALVSNYLDAGVSYYVYNQLSDKERAWWDEYEEIMQDYLKCTSTIPDVYTKGIYVDSLDDVRALKTLLLKFWYSNPQYFFLTPESGWKQDEQTGRFYVYGKLYFKFLPMASRRGAKQSIINNCVEILNKVSNTDGNQAVSFQIIHDELCKKLSYFPINVSNIADDANLVSSAASLSTGLADSLGYSRALSLLCNIYCIDSISVAAGTDALGGSDFSKVTAVHGFNKVRINGYWHNFDACWDDEWNESIVDPLKMEAKNWDHAYVSENILNRENISYEYYGKDDFSLSSVVTFNYVCPYVIDSEIFDSYMPLCHREDINYSVPGKTPSPSINSYYKEGTNDCYVRLLETEGENAVIYYTTDGTIPDMSSSKAYVNGEFPFIVKGKNIVKAVAVVDGKFISDVVTQRVQNVVYYELNGGINNPENITDYDIGTTGTFELKKPTKDYYDFEGWYTSSRCLPAERIQYIDKSLNRDIKIYANWVPKSYNVFLDTTGGYFADGVSNNMTVTYTEPYGFIPVPERRGYDFNGWYISDNRIKGETIVNTPINHTLTARWKARRYIVTFDPVKGESLPSYRQVEFDSEYGWDAMSANGIYELPRPDRAGYTFTGWTLSGASVSKDTIVNTDKNHTLSAEWEGNPFKLIFETDGGVFKDKPYDNVPYKIVRNDEVYGSLPVPDKTGYDFIRWTDGSGNPVSENTITSTLTDILLKAVYEAKVYSVKFNPNAGSCSVTSKNVEFDKLYYNVPKSGDIEFLPRCVRTGYDFAGWYTVSDIDPIRDSDKRITDFTQVKIPDDHTLYAGYTPKYFSVSLNGNGGYIMDNGRKLINSVMSVSYDSPYRLPGPGSEIYDGAYRRGYVFKGWFTKAEGGTQVNPSDIVDILEDMVLYAHWEPNVYCVTFDANGGVCDTLSINAVCEYEYGYLPVPKRTGYRFDGWYTATESGNKIVSQTFYDTEGNTVLYAHWIPNVYYISYNGNGNTAGEMSKSRYVYDNTGYLKLNQFEKAGYAFTGWNSLPDGSGISYGNSSAILNVLDEQDAETELFAQWKNIDYKLTLIANFGNFDGEVRKVVNVNYGEVYGTLPVPVRTGYLFTGYYTEPEMGTKVEVNTVFGLLEDQTLYAHWEHVDSQGQKLETDKPTFVPVMPQTGSSSENRVLPRVITAIGKYTAIKGDTVSVNLTGIDSRQIRVKGKGTYSNGVLRLLKKGSVKLYYLNGKKKINLVSFKVVEPSVKKSIRLKAGYSKPIIIKGFMSDMGEVSYSSSKPEVAAVDAAGNVRALSSGTSIITITIGNHVYRTSVSVK